MYNISEYKKVLVVHFVCLCLLQQLKLSHCQIIGIGSCQSDRTDKEEDLALKVKHLHAAFDRYRLQTDKRISKLGMYSFFKCDFKMIKQSKWLGVMNTINCNNTSLVFSVMLRHNTNRVVSVTWVIILASLQSSFASRWSTSILYKGIDRYCLKTKTLERDYEHFMPTQFGHNLPSGN